jgi:hypothetical protein
MSGAIKAESAGKDQGTAMIISFDPLPSQVDQELSLGLTLAPGI